MPIAIGITKLIVNKNLSSLITDKISSEPTTYKIVGKETYMRANNFLEACIIALDNLGDELYSNIGSLSISEITSFMKHIVTKSDFPKYTIIYKSH